MFKLKEEILNNILQMYFPFNFIHKIEYKIKETFFITVNNPLNTSLLPSLKSFK